MVTSKLSFWIYMAISAPVILQVAMPTHLFSASDLMAGLLGQAVFAVGFIIINLTLQLEGKKSPLTARAYVLVLLQLCGAGMSTFAIMSILRAGGFWFVKMDVSTPEKAHIAGVVIGFAYALTLQSEVRDIFWNKIKEIIKTWGTGKS